MIRMWRIITTLVITCSLSTANGSEHANRTRARNTQWFEGQIDDFIRNVQAAEDGTDIQVSTCKISSQQLVATAQATAARVLKGICNPEEMDDRFHNLETQLGDQLNVIKAMLLSIEDKLIEQDQELKRNQRKTMTVLTGIRRTNGNGNGGSTSHSTGGGSTTTDDTPYSPPYIPSIPHRAQEVVEDDDDNDVEDDSAYGLRERRRSHRGRNVNTHTSSSDADIVDLKSGRVGPRSSEIGTYNSTVHVENGKRVFTFYWIVTGMAYKINNWSQQRVLRSNSFYTNSRGYRLFMKMIPKYSATTMFLHVGITKGDYDELLEWPFGLKMKLSVLDQNDSNERAQDMHSRLWDPKELCSGSNWVKPVVGDNPECFGLGIPHDAIKTRNYIWNDRMILKLIVFLD